MSRPSPRRSASQEFRALIVAIVETARIDLESESQRFPGAVETKGDAGADK